MCPCKSILAALILSVSLSAADGDPTVTWTPGCLAKIYVCGKAEVAEGHNIKPGPSWPITALPDSPAETLLLPSLPSVEPPTPSDMFEKQPQSNVLLPKSKVLAATSPNFYAVEFEGYFLSTTEGVYTISAESDDPVSVYVEGQLVAESKFSANPSNGRQSGYNEDMWNRDQLNDPSVKVETNVCQGSVRLGPNRYYHVSIIARQAWYPVTRERYNGKNIRARDFNRGAFFKAFVNTPDNKSSPLSLALPQVK